MLINNASLQRRHRRVYVVVFMLFTTFAFRTLSVLVIQNIQLIYPMNECSCCLIEITCLTMILSRSASQSRGLMQGGPEAASTVPSRGRRTRRPSTRPHCEVVPGLPLERSCNYLRRVAFRSESSVQGYEKGIIELYT